MSDDDTPDTDDSPHPRSTLALFGHGEAETALLDAYRSGRMPHAWLIGGPAGIGKATLAFRMARFVLAHPDPASREVQQAKSLAVDAEAPAAKRIAGEAHPDLLVLERTLNDKGKLRQDIAVDDVRRSVGFFGSTAGEGGWRVAIVDTVDDLNGSSANALLKVVEEPPEKSLLLLVSHSPGRVMATIRSRCRRLMLRPLDQNDVAKAAANTLGMDEDAPPILESAAAAQGSVGRALALIDGKTLALRQKVVDLLEKLPNTDPRALHALGEAIGGTEPQTLRTFSDIVNGWLTERLRAGARETAQLARFANAWERVNGAVRDADTYNLDRKPLVFAVFGLLAEAARG
jgi:DNA polymerase-3 subunit delta'